MFELTRRSTWMDWLRVPTVVGTGLGDGETVASWHPSGRKLAWYTARPNISFERYSLGGIPIYARGVATQPPGWERGWTPADELTSDGSVVGFVWRSDEGSVFLPFDPDDALLALQSETYSQVGDGARSEAMKGLARRAYYRARPLVPRSAQLTVRRAYSRLQRRQGFPSWPVETALHDLLDRLMLFASEVAGESVPTLAPWPRPFSWALVLTHDVEKEVGYSRVREICDLEDALGYRSSWNLVPLRDYTVEDGFVVELQRSGWEVGVHGLHHDGRDLESRRVLAERLPQIREWAERWGATGFRSPATQRAWSLMPSLGFDYDSSYPDTDPFEPQGGGCCSWLPFFNAELVELPITLPQDHTLFVILGEQDARIWLEKTAFLRDRGGMALIDTHPDYLLDEPAASAYGELLRTYADDHSAWRALPAEIASWWRRRAATSIERAGGSWRVIGPGRSDAAMSFTSLQAA